MELRLRNVIATAIAILLILSISGCTGKGEPAIIVAGSTSVQPYAEILAEEFERLYPDSGSIDIQGGGSSAGITAADTGTADIGMTSRALSEQEQGIWVIEIAKDGLAIIVNPSNPVDALTLEQVCKIYSKEISNWSEVGGKDAEIHIIAREEGSGTRSAFEELVMGEVRITPKAIIQNSNGAVRMLVEDDTNAIGFISLGLVDSADVKALRLNGIEATHDNIVNGSYGLYRPFLFVAKEQPAGAAMDFIEFIRSSDGQQILINEGLIP